MITIHYTDVTGQYHEASFDNEADFTAFVTNLDNQNIGWEYK